MTLFFAAISLAREEFDLGTFILLLLTHGLTTLWSLSIELLTPVAYLIQICPQGERNFSRADCKSNAQTSLLRRKIWVLISSLF